MLNFKSKITKPSPNPDFSLYSSNRIILGLNQQIMHFWTSSGPIINVDPIVTNNERMLEEVFWARNDEKTTRLLKLSISA